MTKQKVNASAIINKLRVVRCCVPLCHMVVMLVVYPPLKTNILKLEGDFFNAYRDGDRVFYLFVTNETGFFQDVIPDLFSSWFAHWIKANDIFEYMLELDLALHCFKNKVIFI